MPTYKAIVRINLQPRDYIVSAQNPYEALMKVMKQIKVSPGDIIEVEKLIKLTEGW